MRVAKSLPSQAYLKTVLSYDPETGIFRWAVTKGARGRAGTVAGSAREYGYICIGIDGRVYLAHRLAWVFVHGDGLVSDVDHADGNPGNNRILNLRPATATQNLGNRARSRGKTLPKGVYLDHGRFRAILRDMGKNVSLGAYQTADEAHAAYKTAALAKFGEFARFD